MHIPTRSAREIVDKLRGKDVLRFYSPLMCMKNMQQKIQLTGNPANFSGCKSEMNRSDGLPERLEFYRRIQRTFPSVAPFNRRGRLRSGHSKRFERSFIERLERSAALEPLERLKPAGALDILNGAQRLNDLNVLNPG
jgi:hypothetical protein